MKKYYLSYILTLSVLAACSVEDELNPDGQNEAVELKGIVTEIAGSTSTRSVALDAYNYVGRSAFVADDKMILTTIKRTDSPIVAFTYSGIGYKYHVEASQTSGSWNRVNEEPERIYWSDAANGHTYIGYSTPQQETGTTFDWNVKTATYSGSGTEGIPVYYGSLGDPTLSGDIDYTNADGETPVLDDPKNADSAKSYKTGNEKIKHDDLLLTYDNNKTAEIGGSVAKLYYYHALAMVRVIVKIQGFAASTSSEDSKSVVSDMVLEKMLTLYKWKQQSAEAEALEEQYDKDNINAIYNVGADGSVKVDQKKDIRLWIPRPAGTGTGVGKQFTFYGLAVPCAMGKDNPSAEEKAGNLQFKFKVTYPDPMNPTQNVDKTYEAAMPGLVRFMAGKCTTIEITLNHNNEEMTVGAEYTEWQYVETPDQGELKKGSNFLGSTERTDVTIADDTKATPDDATWLYKETDSKVVDIYGNDGTAEHPYTICNADQWLSFAYEVNNGRTFVGQYVKLDADLVLQPSLSLETATVSWIGIGDATHAFNGTFIGGNRQISCLKGSALFVNVGSSATIDHLALLDVKDIGESTGALVATNAGKIQGCRVEGPVTSTSTAAVGGIVGTNSGTMEVCYHIGDVKGEGSVGGLVGKNDTGGKILACYHSGKIESSGNRYGIAAENSGKITSCYYDLTLASDVSLVAPSPSLGVTASSAKPTTQMQKSAFVFALNAGVPSTSTYSFVFAPTMYPQIGAYSEMNRSLPEGFYRVKNVGSSRYAFVEDNTGHCNQSGDDLHAIVLSSEKTYISDPASIIYAKPMGNNHEYELISQGTSIKEITGHYAIISTQDGHYRVGAQDNLLKYLGDNNGTAVTTAADNYRLWDPILVDEYTENYFGLSLGVTAESKHFASFYAGFGYEAASSGMEFYYVSQLDETAGKVCLKKISGTVPNNTPVIVAGTSSASGDNRLALRNNTSVLAGRNFLKGNMFNYSKDGRENRLVYDPATMRVLEVQDGKLVFVKKETSELPYLPANTAYLVVSSGAPEVIYAETEDVYSGPTGATTIPITSGYYLVKNVGSEKYLSVHDDKVSISIDGVNVTHDLGALTLTSLTTPTDNSDPSYIMHVTAHDITSQGVSLKSKISYFEINAYNEHYRIGATKNGLVRYLSEKEGKLDTRVGDNKNYMLWDVEAITSMTLNQNVGFSDGTTRYLPFYAEFGFTAPEGVKVYCVTQIDAEGKVHLKALTGEIPNKTPVILAWTETSTNLALTDSNTSLSVTNLLQGNMFNSTISGHVNQTANDPNTMRVLEVQGDKLVFVQKTTEQLTYLPANQSYLSVSTGTAETLEIVIDQ